MLLICALLSWVGPRLNPAPTRAVALECSQVVGHVSKDGAEWLECFDEAFRRQCPSATAGRRYRGCEELGAVRGPVLSFRRMPLEINLASEEDLRVLPRVGPGLARRIIDARADGPFCAEEELKRVHGIGAKTARRIAEHLTFDHPLCKARTTR